jgi:hypothetical protein
MHTPLCSDEQVPLEGAAVPDAIRHEPDRHPLAGQWNGGSARRCLTVHRYLPSSRHALLANRAAAEAGAASSLPPLRSPGPDEQHSERREHGGGKNGGGKNGGGKPGGGTHNLPPSG